MGRCVHTMRPQISPLSWTASDKTFVPNSCHLYYSIMSTKQPPFEYSTLERVKIRLLRPQADDSSGLKWELEPELLLNGDGDGESVVPCDYDALSYTWGSPNDEYFAITCNNRTLMVRKNLYSAFPCLAKRLRQVGSLPRRIWIDAICINQSDEDGKKDQIRRMASIYRLARQVVVWLGSGRGMGCNLEAIALLPLVYEIGMEA